MNKEELKRNLKFKIVAFGLVVLAIIIPAIRLLTKNQQPKDLISPLPASKTLANYEEEQKSISYYITISQEFLNKARELANSEQTPAEKQTIIASINQALDLANQAIAFYPNDDRGFSQRASIYQALIPFLPESANFAIQDLKEAIKLNRQNPQYRSRLAELYLIRQMAGDFENAALAFYNAYVLTPTDIQTIYDLADALEKSGQLKKASRYFEKLIGLLPANAKNLETIKNRQQQLEAMLAQANLEYLTEPGVSDLAPQPVVENKIIGTQELPLEQAALTSQVIIAGPATSKSDSVTSRESHSTSLRATLQEAFSINAKTGMGVIPAGETEVMIENNHVANDKQIVLVATSDTENKVLFLKAKKEGTWFKAGIDKQISHDLKFNWWIVD